MRVGSLVVCINAKGFEWTVEKPLVKDEIYTVRSIDNDPTLTETGIRLEEVYNDPDTHGYEWTYRISRFREIQPPMKVNLAELMTEFEPA
jgi:hypothetical protein